MKILVAYFSLTGNTERIADEIIFKLRVRNFEPVRYKIRPMFKLPYIIWLVLSFIPSISFPLRRTYIDFGQFDLIFFGLPKWTFNCPPATAFIRMIHKRFKNNKPVIAIFLTYGGFMEDNFLRQVRRQIEVRGFNILNYAKFKRREIRENLSKISHEVDKFIDITIRKFQSIHRTFILLNPVSILIVTFLRALS